MKYQTQLGGCPANVASCGYLYAFVKSDEFFWSYSFGAAAKPAPLSWPTISGTGHAVGSMLTPNHATAADGTWANAPTSYAYQWVRCDPVGELTSCSDIVGATGSGAYTLVNADAGSTLRIKVTASNGNGSTHDLVGADRGDHRRWRQSAGEYGGAGDLWFDGVGAGVVGFEWVVDGVAGAGFQL